MKDDLKKSAIEELSIDSERYKKFEKAYKYALDMTRKETKQAIEGLYHNLNTLQSRSGNQLPFTSINYGTCTESEGRLFTELCLETSIKGLGKLGRTSIFPCGIFQYQRGVNDTPDTPNYDLFKLALKSTSKRLYPNYCLVDWSNNANAVKADRAAKQAIIDNMSNKEKEAVKAWMKNNPIQSAWLSLEISSEGELVLNPNPTPLEINSTMGCRTCNLGDINADKAYFENIFKKIIEGKEIGHINYSGIQKDGRGNVCPVTIIMPTLAMIAKEQEGDIVSNFMVILDKKIHEAKDMLLERFYYIASQSPASAKFMYENCTMAGYVPEEGIVSALKHGTLALGQLGLAETLHILIGKDQTTEEGMELAKRIEKMFNTRCAEFKKEYHMNFGVYFTPAENLCHTSFKKWKSQYGDVENVTFYKDEDGNKVEKSFFTNSMHVPVWKEMSPFDKIDIESQLTGFSNAGCITYVEVEHEVVHNIDALESLVKYAMDKDIPYFAINCPSDTCEDCGYQGQIDGECPVCGGDHISRLRRITGYLTGDYKTAFNKGKQNEVSMRVKHKEEIDLCQCKNPTCGDN